MRLFLAFLLGMLISPAQAQTPPCAPRDAMVASLGSMYAEEATGRGLSNEGHMVEIYTSSDGSTWTLIMIMPNGMACVTGTGKGWRTVKLPVKKLGPRI